jgi:hypothetical protein
VRARIAGHSAILASLSENVQREAMHPADEFDAFARLVGAGKAIEDIAASFEATPLVVQRRLMLAACHRASQRTFVPARCSAHSTFRWLSQGYTELSVQNNIRLPEAWSEI